MLARDLGWRSVYQMEREMSNREWQEWHAYYSVLEDERGSNG